MDNIVTHNLPLIRNNKLAENVQDRMDRFSAIRPIEQYAAFINVGGGVASLGTSFNLKLLPPGVVVRTNVTDVSRPGGIEGALPKFAKANVPILHILNIRPLTAQFNMPFAP